MFRDVLEIITFRRKAIVSSEFARNTMVVFFGSITSQLIPLLFYPILTRIYSPSDFGTLTIFISVTSVLSVFATGRYEPAIVLPKNDKDSVNVVFLCFLILTAASFFAFIVVIFFGNQLLKLFGELNMGLWIYWLPLSIFLMGSYQILYFWHTRNKNYKNITLGRISQNLAMVTVQGGGAIDFLKPFGLIGGQLVGQLLAVLWFGKSFKENFNEKRKGISILRIKAMACRYKDFPIINSLNSFFDLLQSNGIIYLIVTAFSAPILGFYSLTLRVLGAPSALIGKAVCNVLYQKLSFNFQNKLPILPVIRKIIIFLIAVSFPIYALIFFTAQIIFPFVFGEKWLEAGIYAQILIPWMALNFVSSPLSNLPFILKKQKLFFLYSSIGNTIVLSVFAIACFLTRDIKLCLMLFSTFFSLYTIGYISLIYKASINYDKSIV